MDVLISVLMPCYNMARSLPSALGSLAMQTYKNWECILVDDGSTDNPAAVVDALQDERIRLVLLEENKGRGFARRIALESARGDLITMLDADDWMFQDRLEKQVELLQEFPDAALVDCGVAVVDAANELRGVVRRVEGNEPVLREPFRELGRLPVASHASCMIRGDVARQATFDPALPRGEDQDFLFRVLMDRRYLSWGRVHYVYRGFKKHSLSEVLLGYECEDRVFSKYSLRFPVLSPIHRLRVRLKAATRKITHRFEGERFLSLRYQKSTPEDMARFEVARKALSEFVKSRFGSASSETEGDE